MVWANPVSRDPPDSELSWKLRASQCTPSCSKTVLSLRVVLNVWQESSSEKPVLGFTNSQFAALSSQLWISSTVVYVDKRSGPTRRWYRTLVNEKLKRAGLSLCEDFCSQLLSFRKKDNIDTSTLSCDRL